MIQFIIGIAVGVVFAIFILAIWVVVEEDRERDGKK